MSSLGVFFPLIHFVVISNPDLQFHGSGDARENDIIIIECTKIIYCLEKGKIRKINTAKNLFQIMTLGAGFTKQILFL